MMRFFKKQPRAFTLIELLVVMAIISMLAALSLAATNSARANAQAAESSSNLRQWAIALHQYTADNDGALPRRGQGVQPLNVINRPEDWFNALPPYLGQPTFQQLVASGHTPKAGDHSIFVCPGVRDPGGKYFLSYSMNMNLSPWNLPAATRLDEIAQPSLVVFMGEAPGPYSSTYPSTRPYSVLAPHMNRGVLLFLDGHAQKFSRTYIGCGVGDPHRADISWLTGTASDAQASTY